MSSNTKKSNHAKKSKGQRGVNPKYTKKERHNNLCPVCGAKIQMVHASEMNLRFVVEVKEPKLYWRCSNYPHCDTYVTADPVTKKPSGLLAGPALRHKRACIHAWEELFIRRNVMDKQAFRSMCAYLIGFRNPGMVHTRYMIEMECDTILNHLQKMYENRKDIKAIVDAVPNTKVWKQVRGFNDHPNHGVAYAEDGSIISIREDTVRTG